MVSFQIYTGVNSDDRDYNKVNNVVQRLITDDYREKGYSLYTDRFYTGPRLFEDLFKSGVNATGTVMPNRAGLPKAEIKKEGKMKKGETTVFTAGLQSGRMVFQTWMDKRPVRMLTTEHPPTMKSVKGRRHDGYKNKPFPILKYNKFKVGVDLSDQLEGTYLFTRATRKCWKKLAFYIIGAMTTNAYVLYRKKHVISHKGFIEEVVKGFLLISVNTPRPGLSHRVGQKTDMDGGTTRLKERHFISVIPDPVGNAAQRRPRRICEVCRSQKRKTKTTFECVECGKSLCLQDCFKKYHTKMRYWVKDDDSEVDQ